MIKDASNAAYLAAGPTVGNPNNLGVIKLAGTIQLASSFVKRKDFADSLVRSSHVKAKECFEKCPPSTNLVSDAAVFVQLYLAICLGSAPPMNTCDVPVTGQLLL